MTYEMNFEMYVGAKEQRKEVLAVIKNALIAYDTFLQPAQMVLDTRPFPMHLTYTPNLSYTILYRVLLNLQEPHLLNYILFQMQVYRNQVLVFSVTLYSHSSSEHVIVCVPFSFII